jgi:hypothetical protein
VIEVYDKKNKAEFIAKLDHQTQKGHGIRTGRDRNA